MTPHTTPTALTLTRRLAQRLGEGWTAASRRSTLWAVLEGPEGFEADVRTSRADGTFRIVPRPVSQNLLQPGKRDGFHLELEGSAHDPEALADRITAELAPLLLRREHEQAARTATAQAALAQTVQRIGITLRLTPDVSTWPHVPGHTHVRWSGGRVHLHADGQGQVTASDLHLRVLDAAQLLALLAIAPGAER
ncbi:hypothetical protein [Streptacidiphilus sp. EB103A]|uniref:hypothetical protein n=1 Tax=Streptacidiphilus sp. EB103A TaxID=3156275 RepID=UPI003513F774